MTAFQIVKLSSDILLLASLCLLSYRILANGNISGKLTQLLMLEASLKSLIRDAEGAGRGLNDDLERRERNLERVLGEISNIERKVLETQKAIANEKDSLDKGIASAQKIGSELVRAIKVSSNYASANNSQMVSASAATPQPASMVNPTVEAPPEPPSFQPPARGAVGRTSPILPPRNRQHPNRQGLADKIQRETVVNEQIKATARKSAEAAKEIERLTEDKVTQSSEQIPQKAPAADSRLGVLGQMKRQVQTL